jgi:hypothetical protein
MIKETGKTKPSKAGAAAVLADFDFDFACRVTAN